MSLRNRFKFLNNNLMNVLKPEHFNFLKKAEKFYVKFEEKNNITHKEDFYDWIPEIGKAELINRVNNYDLLGLDFQPYGIINISCSLFAFSFFLG